MRAVLWAGIVWCMQAVFRGMDSISAAVSSLRAPTTWLLMATVPIGTWVLAVAGWRQLVAAYTGEMPGWTQSFRQSGLLLVGKYVPGGVFGFLARLYDVHHSRRASHLAAGLAEQLLGVLAPTIIGAICYCAAIARMPLLLMLLVAAPFIIAAGLVAAERIVRKLRWRRGDIHRALKVPHRTLAPAAIFCAQQLVWVGLASWIAKDMSNLSALNAIGVGGCFGLAVAAGMLIVLVPGGIGVREGAFVALAMTWMDSAHAVVLASVLRLSSVCLDMLAGLVALVLKRVMPSSAFDDRSE
jgi:glycosyltransferase 2 family protein